MFHFAFLLFYLKDKDVEGWMGSYNFKGGEKSSQVLWDPPLSTLSLEPIVFSDVCGVPKPLLLAQSVLSWSHLHLSLRKTLMVS